MTTNGEIALRNLNGNIEELESFISRSRNPASARLQLVDRLLERSKVLRRYADLERAGILTEEAVRHSPNSGAALFARARYRGAIHEFGLARVALDQASRAGVNDVYQRAAIDLASTPSRQTLTALASEFRSDHSFQGWVTSAAIASARGRFAESDRAWTEALGVYSGVSPIVVAWVHFQRGVMWSERAGQPDRARPLYQESVRVLPGYVAAQLHLAELEAAAGEDAKAIERLTVVNSHTEDNEVPSLLASLLRTRSPAVASEMRRLAKARYRRWSQRFPDALAHHKPGPEEL